MEIFVPFALPGRDEKSIPTLLSSRPISYALPLLIETARNP